MKIFDCFTFNNELDILEYRLEKLYSIVDKFVLVEARQTHTGNPKPLYFKEAEKRFEKWKDKIAFFEFKVNVGMDDWTFENNQRDYIRECLKSLECSDSDIVFISDVDEIMNIPYILKSMYAIPCRIEMPLYYYFSNLRANEMWDLAVCCRWIDIKNTAIGDRLKYTSMFPILFRDSENKNGGHFSYLFGYSIRKYKQKISSFAHNEFNNFYFKDTVRLKYCISTVKDIYERSWIKFEVENSNIEFSNSKIITKIDNYSYYPLRYNAVQRLLIEIYIYILKLLYRFLLKIKILKK